MLNFHLFLRVVVVGGVIRDDHVLLVVVVVVVASVTTYTLTCSTRRILEKVGEIVSGRITRAHGFTTFEITRKPFVARCASLECW